MDIQKELNEWADWFIPHDSKDLRDALELNSFNQLNVEKLLAINGLAEAYAFRAKDSWKAWQAAKAQAVPDGFVLVERSKLLQILGSAVAINTNPKTKINLLESDFIIGELKAMIKAQEPANNVAPELVNNDVTYVIELQGYEAIEHARVTLKKKGYKTWDYTDKDSIDDADIYVLCVCPSTPNDSALVKGAFKGIHQGKFTYIQTDLESCPDAQEQKG